jgi:NAD(P)-dependent dehydrogenase (short-subunit alcohol dehydrogenase family)
MIAEVIEKFGKLDGLVNNAGGQFPSALKIFLLMALMLWFAITCIQHSI